MLAKLLTARVGSDGILRLEVPMGVHLAGCEVDIAVAQYKIPETDEEKRAVVRGLAGSVTDPNFVRPPQGEFQERDPL